MWQWGCTTPTWDKWQPQHPTSPHWYTVERFQALLAAYLTQDRYQGRVRSVREVVAEFAGLKGTAAQKAVTADAGLSGASLEDLVVDGGMDVPRVRALLKAMQARSRLIKPATLGVIGDTHLRTIMGERLGVDPESLTYKKYMGEVEGMPYVVELACGWFVDWDGEQEGTKLLGVNWTPALRPPFACLDYLLDEAQVECYDPVVLAIHLAYPRVEVTDRGKSAVALPGAITQVLEAGVTAVTKPWRALKRQADHTRRVRLRDMEYWRKQQQRQWLTVKAAAAQVMEAAYHKASGGNRFPANARQIMYAARGDIITLTNKNPPWKHSAYFTQHLLPDFVNEHPELTRDWDVIFDARGHLIEPHTGYQLGIGTLEVREYIAAWHGRIPTTLEAFMLRHAIATRGPRHRYQYALFVEKEGFHPLLERAQMAARYDVTLMSTKGMSVVAARRLLEELTRAGVTTLVLHDCDKAGFEILDKFRSDTRRHTYAIQPTVEDLGLRLADAQAMGLQSEQVYYQGQKDPRESLRRCGATPAECAFLVQRRVGEGWEGERIELNAMDSVTFITWLEAKLVAAGVRKLVPEGEALTAAYQRMAQIAMLQRRWTRRSPPCQPPTPSPCLRGWPRRSAPPSRTRPIPGTRRSGRLSVLRKTKRGTPDAHRH